MAWLPDERIIYDAFDNGRTHLWVMNGDGSNKRQLSPEAVEDYRPTASPDGRFLVFLSNRSGAWQLWRSNTDGSDPQQLTFGKDSPRHAKFAANGSRLVFEYFLNNAWRLVQMPVEGGEMTPLTDVAPEYWDVAPDGKTIAYSFSDAAKNLTRVAVQTLEDKSKTTYLEIAPRDFLLFSPDGKSLLTKPPSSTPNSISAIYSFPIAGGEARKVVSNPPENFYWADRSFDGKRLAWVQGKVVSNVVLLTSKN
jgi:TolB protein